MSAFEELDKASAYSLACFHDAVPMTISSLLPFAADDSSHWYD
jgi:hypothetical protein